MTIQVFARRQRRPVWPYLMGIAAFAVSVQFGLDGPTLDRLGLTAEAAMLLLLATVACRSFNLRLYVMSGGRERLQRLPKGLQRVVLKRRSPFFEETAVALNVGGGVIPLAFSAYELFHASLDPSLLWIASILIAGVTQIVRCPAQCAGLRLPFVLVSPAVALLVGWSLGAEHRAAFACVSGFAGILAGADLLDLHDVPNIGISEVVVGGGASFDAIFLNQMFSLLFC